MFQAVCCVSRKWTRSLVGSWSLIDFCATHQQGRPSSVLYLHRKASSNHVLLHSKSLAEKASSYSLKKYPEGGSWNRTQWREAKETLGLLLTQEEHQQSSSLYPNSAFLLLERLVSELPNLQQDSKYTLTVDVSFLNQILNNWCQAWKDSRKETSNNLTILTPPSVLQWVDSLALQAPDVIRPNADTYRYLMDASLAHFPLSSDDGEKDQKPRVHFVESIFRRMNRSLDPSLTATVDDFHRVMHAYIYYNKDVTSAERFLDEQKRLYFQNGGHDARFRPTNFSYYLIIAGWAKKGAPRQATACLTQMIQEGIVAPERSNFETCLNAWVKSSSGGQTVAGQHAEIILLQMQDMHNHRGLDTKPYLRNVGKVVAAWAASKHKDAAARAEAVMRLMLNVDAWDSSELSELEDTRALADGFLNVIRSYSLVAKDKRSPEKCAALMAELKGHVGGTQNIPPAILRRLYSCLIMAWARSRRKNAADMAQAVFDRMKQDYLDMGVEFSPDRFCYSSLLDAWSRVGDGNRAEEIWSEMHRNYLCGNKNCETPDTKSMNLVILAWSRSPKNQETSRRRAEEVFTEMTGTHSIKPDVITYTALLSALGGTTEKNAALRGEEYLQQLNDLYLKGRRSCRPDVVTYTKAILLWSNIKSAEAVDRAQALLDEMVRRFQAGEHYLQPNEQTLKAFLSVLENSDLPDKNERARLVRISISRLSIQ